MVLYSDQGGWEGTQPSFDYVNQYTPNMDYCANNQLPWMTDFRPFHFIMDLETKTLLAKDTVSAKLSYDEMVSIVEANNL